MTGQLHYAVKQFLICTFLVAKYSDVIPVECNANRLCFAIFFELGKAIRQKSSKQRKLATSAEEGKSAKRKRSTKDDASLSDDDVETTEQELIEAKILVLQHKLRKLKQRRAELLIKKKN